MKTLVETAFDVLQIEKEYSFYCEAADIAFTSELNEFTLPSFLSRYVDFFKAIGNAVSVSKDHLVEMLKSRGVFDFFRKFSFSMKKIFDFIRNGFKAYSDIQRAIADFIRQTKIVKWTEEAILRLDAFLNTHPKLKRIAGIALGAALIYIWLNMTFTGDFAFDFDQTTLFAAIKGTLGWADVFTGTEGTRLLMLFITGRFVTFPWPGPGSALFIGSLIFTLGKMIKAKWANDRMKLNVASE
jgi:hypothetical protein